jgi:hypothetical protein
MSNSWFGRWVPPLKETEDRPDFTLLEKRIAELTAGDEEAAKNTDAIKAEIAKMSSMRAACIMPRQLDEAALERLKEYFRQLRMVHRRVSSSKIVFKWRCSITPRGGGMFTSDPAVCKGGLGLEMRAVAHQMAVCCAGIGSRLAESDELPKANKWFKNAYHLFNYARDGIEVDLAKDCELNRDLKPDVLLALSRVMLAQAANIFVRVMADAAIRKFDKESDPSKKHERERTVGLQRNVLRRTAPHCLTFPCTAVVPLQQRGQHDVPRRAREDPPPLQGIPCSRS